MAHGQKTQSAQPRQAKGAGPSTSGRKDSEFAVGTKTQCTAAFDNQLHPAEILETRTDPAGKQQYYVHFLDSDKRLDEWVTADKLLPPNSNISRLETVPSLALVPGELAAQADGQKITRRLKRRLEDSHAIPGHLDDSKDHGGPEKEHAERTKVKNVQVRMHIYHKQQSPRLCSSRELHCPVGLQRSNPCSPAAAVCVDPSYSRQSQLASVWSAEVTGSSFTQ
eukprot:GHUV01008960.1.p1 GENE.GHUV01008960.1~~GHUV01008960.1.p1  ORF type:complete len:223 (+),score=36.69 GHUV01008960.1:289-957(+)